MPDNNETTVAITEGETARSPFCRELRSKKFYFLEGMPTEEQHLLDNSNYCWCRKTMQALGPDGNLVQPVDCTTERKCYVSLFE